MEKITSQSALRAASSPQGEPLRNVFCFTCGNTKAQVVATKGECNLVECTQCGCRWRRSLDPLYERTALVEVDVDNTSQSGLRPASSPQGEPLRNVFCFTCGNTKAQVVATKAEYNLVECTHCGCRWRRSLDPLYERTALVEVDVDNTSQSGLRPASEGELAQSAKRGHPGVSPQGEPLRNKMLFEQRNAIY